MPTVLISTSSFGRHGGRALDRLEAAGWQVRTNPHGRRLERAETAALLAGADALIAGTERLDREILAGASRLRVISRCGGGLDNVDLEAARELGIVVASAPGPPARAVAELALAGILHLLREVGAADRNLRSGRWRKRMGRLLHRKTVGLVGFGRVGRRLAELLAPFEVELLVADPEPDRAAAERLGARYVELDELLARADVVSLHLPLTARTRHLIGASELASMRPGSVLVNTARGGLVDEEALAERLRDGALAGAYLDVFEREPYEGPLTGLSNVLLTPHVGSYAAESRERMEVEAVENLLLSFPRDETG
ncbi:MAG: phosphoglycerate dehydrogenase [Thermoanaerobaculia bacterium]|nr:phosphoglycerate dehydrogenase [Thermoanaerobaculia bacterium]